METLYHADIFIPEWFTMPTERVRLEWSQHARKAAWEERYGRIPTFQTIPLSQFSLIELGVRDGAVSKIVVRGHYDSARDVIFVLCPEDTHYFVKTVWMNLRSDEHKSLDRSRYAVA